MDNGHAAFSKRVGEVRSSPSDTKQGDSAATPTDAYPTVGDSTTQRLFIVSDNEERREKLLRHLLRDGFAASTATRSRTALNTLDSSTRCDLLLVDLTNSSQCHRVLSRAPSALPDAAILVLVDPVYLQCEQAGQSMSADDFIVAPFSPHELSRRIEALLHQSGQASHVHTVRDLMLDLRTRSCYRDGQCVALTAREFDVLDHLFEHRGQALSREALIEGVWGTSEAISPRTIDRHVASIRRKIEKDASAPVYLQTVYGEGYRFTPTG